MISRTFCSIAMLCLVTQVQATILERDDVRSFLEYMATEHSFDYEELQSIFREVNLSENIIKTISRPAEKLPWYKYRPIFLQNDRINLGVKFWKRHRVDLQKAEAIYGVPAEIMVAIIGVETRYGRNAGRYKVIDSLATLAFDYPKRSDFFKNELIQYLLLTREQGLDPLTIRGSYAGAMGIPQFISSSYRNYAVDFDEDGRTDIWNNPVDAIGSIGNYFKEHGWHTDKIIAAPVKIKGEAYKQILNNKMEADVTVGDLERYGIKYEAATTPDAKVTLLGFENRNGKEYWIGFNNFYVITRYNHSMLYAMVVYQLATEIRINYRARVAVNE